MEKRCQQCGKVFDAKLDRAKFCSGSCRALASQGVKPVVGLPVGDAPAAKSSGLFDAVLARVEQADLLGTPEGEAALDIARRLPNANDGSVAAMHRELRSALERVDALKPRPSAVDDLRLRRDRKRARGA